MFNYLIFSMVYDSIKRYIKRHKNGIERYKERSMSIIPLINLI